MKTGDFSERKYLVTRYHGLLDASGYGIWAYGTILNRRKKWRNAMAVSIN